MYVNGFDAFTRIGALFKPETCIVRLASLRRTPILIMQSTVAINAYTNSNYLKRVSTAPLTEMVILSLMTCPQFIDDDDQIIGYAASGRANENLCKQVKKAYLHKRLKNG